MVASFAEAWIEIVIDTIAGEVFVVASFAEAWIEILAGIKLLNSMTVASFAEAWIEMGTIRGAVKGITSPPSRRRGLKSEPQADKTAIKSRLLRGGVD